VTTSSPTDRASAAGVPAPETIERAIADLAVPAPPSLLPRTLVATGLADGYVELATPVGQIYLAFNQLGVSAVSLAGDPAAFEAWFEREIGRRLVRVESMPPNLASAVQRRLAGDRSVRLPFDLRGRSDFERAVLEKALEIPRGEVRPYGWIAAEIGRPKAVRAVGTALGHNPIPLLIPCHRVVRSDGLIGNYSLGGPQVKRSMLEDEGLDLERLEGFARRGIRLIGSDTTHIVCHPTCHHALRITDAHRVPFGSLGEATRAGYRPCRICRPVTVAA
jgi:O-6-methylguanine DNA methyltransferase